jgi:hypothetical protein
VVVPIIPILIDKSLQHLLDGPIEAFNQSIRVGSVRSSASFVDAQQSTNLRKQFGLEVSALIGVQLCWAPKQTEKFSAKDISYTLGGLVGQRECLGPLGKIV